jgi:crotonobetainyl-CoA:carnitine CoA-transferase CaiB-like acyl-CoA transferase
MPRLLNHGDGRCCRNTLKAGLMKTNTGPLHGIKVVDLTRVMTGPYCAMMLGDLGADVIKIEMPGKGDDTRLWGPPFVGDESSYFLTVNRNKRSIALDLKSDTGKEILWKLIDEADVLVENFSPGTIDRLGFGYDAVHTRRPSLVFASISGFGQTGPARSRTAYDLIVQGMSGMMSVTGPDGGMPTKLGIPIADIAAGMFSAYAILGALFHRERDLEHPGQYVDTSMLGGQVALLTYQAGIWFTTGQIPEMLGNRHPIITPYDTFPTADGYVNIAVGNDAIWRRFCDAMGLELYKTDPQFATNASRCAFRQEVYDLVNTAFAPLTTDEIVTRLDAAAVPCGPILTVDEILSHPQVADQELVRTVPHQTLDSVQVTGFPYKFSETPLDIRHGPPVLGQHTVEILAELGFTEDEIEAILTSGAAEQQTERGQADDIESLAN